LVTIQGSVGNANAAGVLAGVLSAVTIQGATGNANAAGATASILAATNISCAVGQAYGAGIVGAVYQGGLVQCTPGGALAGGPTAALAATLQCVVGSASAAGVPFTIPASISCAAAAAVAAGYQAQIVSQQYAEYHRSRARTLQVNESNVAPVPFKKSTASRLDYSFDWTPYLADTEDALTAYSIGASHQIGIGGAFLDGSIATVWVEPGGVAGYSQTLWCDITTAQGRQDRRAIALTLTQ
jgi:hypothetical protein